MSYPPAQPVVVANAAYAAPGYPAPGAAYPAPGAPGYPPGYPGAPMAAPGYPPGYPGAPMMAPGAPMMVAPGAPVSQLAQIVVVQQARGADMLSTLAGLRGIYIEQKVELFEAISGWETPNKYKVSGWDPALGAEKPKAGVCTEELLKFKEKSNCCARQVCGARRPYEMAIFPISPGILTTIPGGGGDPFANRDSLILERPYRAPCLCLWRDFMRVRHASLGYIGEIYNPFTCLHYIFHVRGPTSKDLEGPVADAVKPDMGKTWYIIRGDLFQAGMWFPPLPCGGCKRVTFQIYKGDDVAMTRPVGEISKVFSGFLKEAFTDADNFTVAFPEEATPIQRALIMAAVLAIDFMLFEKSGNANSNNSAGGLLNLLG